MLATGGLGPTHDDVTREGLADALDEPLTQDAVLEEQLRDRFGRIGRMPPSNLRQALRIPSAEALANPIGSAPGWWVDRDGRVTVLMPGVPSEMRRMFDEQVTPRLAARFDAAPLAVRTVKTFGIGESALAEMLGNLLEEPGPGVTAGSTPATTGYTCASRAARRLAWTSRWRGARDSWATRCGVWTTTSCRTWRCQPWPVLARPRSRRGRPIPTVPC